MPNVPATLDNFFKNGFIFIKDASTQKVKKIATSCDLSIGTTNMAVKSIANLNVTGIVSSIGGFSGSLTRLIDGTSYLVAGSNITITTSSNGSVIISSAGGGGGGGSPGGLDTYVQFNDGGSFGGDSGLTYNKTTDSLTVAGDVAINGGDLTTTAASFNVLNGASTLNVGSTSSSRTINIGTGLASQTVNVGASWDATQINLAAGTGRITATSTSTTKADATIGAAQVGSLPGFAGAVAMFGHNSLSHAVSNDTGLGMGNYALAQGNDGATYLNSPYDKGIYFLTSGSGLLPLGRIYFDLGTLTNKISLQGASIFNTDITLGNTWGGSSVTIDSGTGDIDIGTSSAARTINIGTGLASQTINLGSSWAATAINALAGTGRFTATSTSTTKADATLGSAQIGSLPGFAGAVAMFGHNSLNHAVNNDTSLGMGNYAIAQGNDGATYLNSPYNKGIYFLTSGSGLLPLGRIYFNSATLTNIISLQGVSIFDTDITLGNTWGGSSVTIDAGTGNIDIGTSNSSRTINVGTTTTINNSINVGGTYAGTEINISAGDEFASVGGVNIIAPMTMRAEARIGAAQVGSLPLFGYPRSVAFFGNNSLNHSINATTLLGMGNYALAQTDDGSTFINSPIDRGIYLTTSGSVNYLGRIYFNSGDLTSKIILQGASSFNTDVFLGSTYGGSSVTIDAGTGDIDIGTSNSSRTINVGTTTTINNSINIGGTYTGTEINISAGDEFAAVGGVNIVAPMTTRAEARVGAAQIGSLPLLGYPRTVAFFGNNSLNHAVNATTLSGMGNYALAQTDDGSTFVNSPIDTGIYLTTSGSVNYLGRVYFKSSTLSSEIYLQGATAFNTNIKLGSSYGGSSTAIYGGSGGITLSGSGGYTTITGSTSTTAEAIIGMAAVGELPATRTSFPNYFSMFGHKNLDQSTLWNYAVVQNGAPHGIAGRGDTFINSPSTIYFQFSGSSGGNVGVLDNNTVSFTGLAGTATTTTIGNTAGASSTTINAGTGYIALTGHTSVNSTTLVNGSGDTSTDYSILLKTTSGGNIYRWGVGVDDTPGDYSFAYGLNNTTLSVRGWLSAAASVGAIDFTGQHRSRPASGNILDFSDKVGMIVVSVGDYSNLTSGSANIMINESLPIIQLSTERNQKSVFGVVSDSEDPNDSSRDYMVGNWGSSYEKLPNDDRVIVNSLGEGAIWICNINGNLENGDYITTCEIAGYGMKQDDDLLHNYTVAKITMDCDFALNTEKYRCEEFVHEGRTYRRAFVGCTYHCG